MPGVKAVCFVMGVLSLLLLAVAGAMAWFAASLPAQQSAAPAPSHFAARVEAARSCEALKAVCGDIAFAYDSQHATMNRLNRLTDDLLEKMAWFAIGWGTACAAAFFYIFGAQASREGRRE